MQIDAICISTNVNMLVTLLLLVLIASRSASTSSQYASQHENRNVFRKLIDESSGSSSNIKIGNHQRKPQAWEAFKKTMGNMKDKFVDSIHSWDCKQHEGTTKACGCEKQDPNEFGEKYWHCDKVTKCK